MESTEPLLSAATRLQNLLTERATGAPWTLDDVLRQGNNEEYQSLRTRLLTESITKSLLPDFVKQCRDTTQFWQFIKGEFSTYKERREYIWRQLRPLIERLENAEADTPEEKSLDIRDPEPLLTTLARLFAQEGAAREVAVLANSKAAIRQIDYDNWNGGTFILLLELELPYQIYAQLGDKCKQIEQAILDKTGPLLRTYPNDRVSQVQITAQLSTDPQWRAKAQAWVAGKNTTNQGRVRSDNIASRSCDGLLFRSQQEIHLYKALKATGVSFAPLPVFVRGGEHYSRIEPDFVIIKDGIVMIVEVDGDTVHHETPAEAHARTTMLAHEGAHVERVRAAECETPEKAKACADKLLRALLKLKASK